MSRLLTIALFCLPACLVGQLYIPDSAIVQITEGARLEVGGDLQNRGILQNSGTLALYGNWLINNNYNGVNGSLSLLGDGNQTLNTGDLTLREVIVNQGGEARFDGSQYTVTENLALEAGVLKTGENTKFILEAGVNPGLGSALAYFDGTLTMEGGGNKLFPLGNEGVYGGLTLLDVFGVNQEISARYVRNNEVGAIPGDSLLGVSNRGYWEVKMIKGTTDPIGIELIFDEEDLTDFDIINNIRHRVNAPVIAVSNDAGGIYESLGLETLFNSDSVTFGTITSSKDLPLKEGDTYYLAMALAPRIPEQGIYYIPEAFSPQASDPKNQRFRIFGEQIIEEGFSLQVYNRYGSLVYSADSFEEANQNGWGGQNQRTGAEEPAGVYYYSVRFQFRTGFPIEKKGAFYLVK